MGRYAAAMVEYLVLGPLVAVVDGRPVDLGGARQRAVLAVLLLHRNSVVSADRMIDLVWGEDPPPTAQTALQGHISRLRRLLGAGAIGTQAPGYVLRVAPGDLDADRFARLVAQASGAPPRVAARRLREALDLVRGPVFADLADVPFVEVESARLEELRMTAVEARVAADLDLDGPQAPIAELEALVAEHPYRERLHALRMLALYRAGRQADALAAYQAARTALDDGLGIDPGPELQAMELAILQQDPGLAAPAGPSGRRGNLPAPPSPLVGRAHDLAEGRAHLSGSTRLLTFTGPGGIGKTRLALEIAWMLADDFNGGAWFADLEGTTTGPSALAAIGSALGLPEAPDRDLLAPLREMTADRPVLLVLDNLEQVPEIAGPLAELLASSPRLRVLATSRSPLSIGAEREHPLAPLATKSDDDGPSDAVTLFAERARAVDPSFQVTPEIAADVERLCARLDGLPLGIELAAARIRLLSPAAILVRIERGVDVLRSERRDLPDRQRSLEAAITWSYDLLDAPERRAFRRLAVFAGGFTLAAFEMVCTEPGDDGLGLLDGLLRHSLVRRRDGESGGPRFGLLDTIRRFALDRFGEAPEDAVRDRHVRHFLVLARALAPDIGEAAEAQRVAELRDDHDNLVAALEWLAANGAVDDLVELAAAGAPYWVRASRYREGLGWIARALDGGSGGSTAARATLLRHRASLSSTIGDGKGAVDFAWASVALWEEAGDRAGLADGLRVLAMVAADVGDLDTARTAAERALEEGIGIGDPRLARAARHELAYVASLSGDLDEALRLLEANAAAMRAADDRAGLAATLGNIGTIRRERGELEQAEAVARESIAIVRTLHDDLSLASVLTTLAEILVDLDRTDEAEASIRESLGYAWRANARRDLPTTLEVLARIHAIRGDHVAAVRLVATAHAIRDAGAVPGWPPELDELVPGAAAALGDDGVDAAWKAGLAQDPERLLRELLGET